ncbi:hypothetical protein GCM10010191_03840 [Actinomadura vinacea]|uniref:ISAs1 family transposase n=1 Tax=Actinomadura vinacea TaxID=115336 RepID=A0ABN3IBG6_9ACTN
MITFDALHTVQDHVKWLVQTKNAHYVAMIKTTQPNAHAQVSAPPRNAIRVQDTRSETGHGRREARSIKTMGIAANLGGLTFPEAELSIRVHRRRKEDGKAETRETVYAVTSLDAHQASPAELADYLRGHWIIENSSPHIRDRVFGEDASTVHHGSAPRAMATLCTGTGMHPVDWLAHASTETVRQAAHDPDRLFDHVVTVLGIRAR